MDGRCRSRFVFQKYGRALLPGWRLATEGMEPVPTVFLKNTNGGRQLKAIHTRD